MRGSKFWGVSSPRGGAGVVTYLYPFTSGTFYPHSSYQRNRTGTPGTTYRDWLVNSLGNSFASDTTNVQFPWYDGYIFWRVPATTDYDITAVGAGQSGCEGCTVKQTTRLFAGEYLIIIPGAMGSDTNQGSGASWVMRANMSSYANSQPILIAGGGGSTYSGGANSWTRGVTYYNPTRPYPTNGSSGIATYSNTGLGGWGYHGAPAGGMSQNGNWGSGGQQGNRAGIGFINGLTGGYDQGDGGFGGGGGYHSGANAGGGGGGFTGGSGGNGYSGNGAGGGSYLDPMSYNFGTNTGSFEGSSTLNGKSISTVGSYNNGYGSVTISVAATPSTEYNNYELINLTGTGSVSIIGNGSRNVSMFKNQGVGDGWDSQAYTSQGFTAPCTIEFTKTSNWNTDNSVSYAMIGWNADPTTDASYSSIDWASYPYQGNSYNIYHNGSNTNPGQTTEFGNTFYIVYGTDGYIRHYNGSTLLYSAFKGTGQTVYLDTSMYSSWSASGGFRNIRIRRAAWNGTSYS